MEQRQEGLHFLIADVSRMLRRAFEHRLEGSSLTLAQARALIYTSRNAGLRQVELAELLEIQPITLARLLDQLADAGLVERRPDPADRRAYRIFPTAAAEAHLNAIEELVTAIRAEAVLGLTKQQAAAAELALQTMRDNLSSR